MKLLISICMSLIILCWPVTLVQGAKYGLASAWLFEETSGKVVKDSVGDNDGDIKGTPTWVPDGKFGRGIEFPGKGDSYVRINHDDVFNADPYTFVAWTKLKPTTWQYVVWRNGDVWPEPKPETPTSRHLDSHRALPCVHVERGRRSMGRIDGKAIVADDKWHHIAKVYDSKSVRCISTARLTANWRPRKSIKNKSPIWIGARPGDVAATGIFDKVGFFTEALSEAQLKTVMEDGLAPVAAVKAVGKLATTWGSLKKW